MQSLPKRKPKTLNSLGRQILAKRASKKANRVKFSFKPQGQKVYVSPAATPIEKGQKHLLAHNIEAIYFDGFIKSGDGKIIKGGGGQIGYGKIKLCGMLKPKKAVIKILSFGSAEFHIISETKKVIEILQSENIKHVKMDVLEFKHPLIFNDPKINKRQIADAIIVMEPFVKKAGGRIISKFMFKTKGNGDMINNLSLNNPIHQDIFRQSIQLTIKLAQNKILIKKAHDGVTGKVRVDAFNAIMTKNVNPSKPSVFIQDIGTLKFDNYFTPQQILAFSLEQLRKSVNPKYIEIAEKLIAFEKERAWI